eukprot:7443635-Heterocapsa_arctica.AAC.1
MLLASPPSTSASTPTFAACVRLHRAPPADLPTESAPAAAPTSLGALRRANKQQSGRAKSDASAEPGVASSPMRRLVSFVEVLCLYWVFVIHLVDAIAELLGHVDLLRNMLLKPSLKAAVV